MVDEFRFDPVTYLEMLLDEVPAYEELQSETARATEGLDVERMLDLGIGTGETSARVRTVHPGAELIGIDENDDMLAAAQTRLPDADLRVAKLEDPLPAGPFDLVFSALSIHHLEGEVKADLFRRIRERLRPDGRFVLADLVVPNDPGDVVTEVDGVYDKPSSVVDQLRWLADAGLEARMTWTDRDLAIVVADAPPEVE